MTDLAGGRPGTLRRVEGELQVNNAEKDLAHALELGRKCGIALPAAGLVSQDMARIYRVKDEGRR